MTPDIFDMLVERVAPVITRKTSDFRQPIPPGVRVAATLRYLATGL